MIYFCEVWEFFLAHKKKQMRHFGSSHLFSRGSKAQDTIAIVMSTPLHFFLFPGISLKLFLTCTTVAISLSLPPPSMTTRVPVYLDTSSEVTLELLLLVLMAYQRVISSLKRSFPIVTLRGTVPQQLHDSGALVVLFSTMHLVAEEVQ